MASGPARLQWYGWLRRLLSGWLSAKVIPPKSISDDLGLDLSKPICYVLRSNSIFDLLTLDIYCDRLKLPRPLATIDELGSSGSASFVYLNEVGILRTYGAYRNLPPSPFYRALKRVANEPDFDLQIVPVSFYWGRDPGYSGKSVFKLFFPDDERAGFFQKAAIVMAHGKNVLLSFSKPIGLRGEFGDGLNASLEQVARKLTRVVKVHFQNKRVAALGPGLMNRNRVIETLVRSKSLREAIDDEVKKKGITRDRAELLAKEYISEIAAEINPQVIHGFSILLRRLWKRIYNEIVVKNIDRVRAIPTNAEIVYVPCHRSHIDYLLLNYVLYDHSVLTPHVAAGVNLNFWPVGSLLRRFGAFYIRRTFNNNRLYSVVFTEYVSFLLQRGSPVQFFLEGGRSRSGKLLTPKTGMVAMVVQSFLRNSDRPIYFVPVYIAYDNVLEVKTYRRELTGSKKKAESVGQLVKTRKALTRNYGDAYIGFGEPIELSRELKAYKADWDLEKYSMDSKPNWMSGFVQNLAQKIMVGINQNAVLGSVGLVSMILNAARTKAMAEDDLLAHVGIFCKIASSSPYSESVSIHSSDSRAIVLRAERFGGLSRFTHPSGDILHLLEPQASYSVYARNNIAHLFALPSLIAFFLQHNDHIDRRFIRRGCVVIYPVLQKEFFLRWNASEIEQQVDHIIDAFIAEGLFVSGGDDQLLRPEMTTPEFTVLRTLGLVIGASVERYSVAINLLHQFEAGVSFNLEDFQKTCVQMSQRISLLTGASDAELPSPGIFKGIVDQLVEQKFVVVENEKHQLTQNFKNLSELTSVLLSADIRHSMSRSRK